MLVEALFLFFFIVFWGSSLKEIITEMVAVKYFFPLFAGFCDPGGITSTIAQPTWTNSGLKILWGLGMNHSTKIIFTIFIKF